MKVRVSGHYFKGETCACGAKLPIDENTTPGVCPLNASGRDDPSYCPNGEFVVAFNTGAPALPEMLGGNSEGVP